MTVLAIETATAVCAAAVVADGTVLAERYVIERYVHSEKLITMIDDLSRQAGDYDALIVSIGPGSFTGLRIGLSVAKGLALALDKPLIAVPTLEALAWRAVVEGEAGEHDNIIAMIDARRKDVYAASYRLENRHLASNWGPEALSLGALLERLSAQHRVVLMGDAVTKFIQHCEALLKDRNRFHMPEEPRRLCSAAAVGLLGVDRALRNDFANASTLEPMYVKDFVTLIHQQHRSP